MSGTYSTIGIGIRMGIELGVRRAVGWKWNRNRGVEQQEHRHIESGK
jgi:hypothetical protein